MRLLRYQIRRRTVPADEEHEWGTYMLAIDRSDMYGYGYFRVGAGEGTGEAGESVDRDGWVP